MHHAHEAPRPGAVRSRAAAPRPARRDGGLPALPAAVDVRHPSLRADPIGMAERIYEALALPFTEEARDGMTGFLEARDASPGGRHHHALETLGLSREGVRDRFADYCEAVDV